MRKPLAAALALVLVLSGLVHAEMAGPSGSVRGSVTTAAGRPVPSVWVLVFKDTREAGRAVTADDGRYYVARLAPGVYTVQVKRGSSVLHRGQVTVSRAAVYDVRLP